MPESFLGFLSAAFLHWDHRLQMGLKVSLLSDAHSHFQVIMIGLDNAGKSTALYRLKTDQYVGAVPTIGFNCEKIKPTHGRAKSCTFTVWDVGGQEKLRPLWRSYIRHTDAIVFVVDSTDSERFEEARLELANLLRSADVPAGCGLLLLANKQDLPSARSTGEIERALGFADLLHGHPSETVGCCAITGEGLNDVFDVVYDLIQKTRRLEKEKCNKKKAR